MLKRNKDTLACNIKLQELEALVDKWEALKNEVDQAIIAKQDDNAKKLKEELKKVKNEVSKAFTEAVLICDANHPTIKKTAALLKTEVE